MAKYLIQNGVVGNCILWWRKNGQGYTVDIDDAEWFDKEDAEKICASIGKNYQMWLLTDIDKCIQSHVTVSALHRQRYLREINNKQGK